MASLLELVGRVLLGALSIVGALIVMVLAAWVVVWGCELAFYLGEHLPWPE